MKKTTQYRVLDMLTLIYTVCTVTAFILAGMTWFMDGFVCGLLVLGGLCGMGCVYNSYKEAKALKEEIEKEKRDRRERYYSLQKD